MLVTTPFPATEAPFIAGDELDGSGTCDDRSSGSGADFVVAGGGNNVVDVGIRTHRPLVPVTTPFLVVLVMTPLPLVMATTLLKVAMERHYRHWYRQ